MILGVLMLFSSVQAVELNDAELYWLTQNTYWEARNQTIAGQILIALVTLNRVNSEKWPDTIQKVVTQPLQFSWFSDGKSDIPENQEAWNTAKKVALFTAMIWDTLSVTDKKIFWYHNDKVDPFWNDSLEVVLRLEKHIFYTNKKPE